MRVYSRVLKIRPWNVSRHCGTDATGSRDWVVSGTVTVFDNKVSDAGESLIVTPQASQTHRHRQQEWAVRRPLTVCGMSTSDP